MKSLLKYLFIMVLSSGLTVIALNQFAPIVITIPKKDKQEIKIDFDQTLAKKDLKRIDRKAKNIILLIGDGMGSNQVTAYRIAKGGPNYIQLLINFPSQA